MAGLTKEDLDAIRRLIREELDNYDRDKGRTPRMGSDGTRYVDGVVFNPYSQREGKL